MLINAMDHSEACAICSSPDGRPLGVIADLAATWVTARDDAPLPGYVCVVSKTHVREPFELPDGQQAAFFGECMAVARALDRLLAPRKMNYEIHGNTIPHLHMHLYPRYAGDPYEAGPIDHHATFRRSPEEIQAIAAAIHAAPASGRRPRLVPGGRHDLRKAPGAAE